MSLQNTNALGGSHIDRQEHGPDYTGLYGGNSVWTIFFTAPDGTQSSVVLPDNQYSAENVAALIMDKTARILSVAALNEI